MTKSSLSIGKLSTFGLLKDMARFMVVGFEFLIDIPWCRLRTPDKPVLASPMFFSIQRIRHHVILYNVIRHMAYISKPSGKRTHYLLHLQNVLGTNVFNSVSRTQTQRPSCPGCKQDSISVFSDEAIQQLSRPLDSFSSSNFLLYWSQFNCSMLYFPRSGFLL